MFWLIHRVYGFFLVKQIGLCMLLNFHLYAVVLHMKCVEPSRIGIAAELLDMASLRIIIPNTCTQLTVFPCHGHKICRPTTPCPRLKSMTLNPESFDNLHISRCNLVYSGDFTIKDSVQGLKYDKPPPALRSKWHEPPCPLDGLKTG